MPILKNARHEAFAQALAIGKTADEAYAAAGYKPNRGNATRMKANESVRKRVTEIVAKISEKAEWSAADRLSALKRISDASEDNDPRVAVSAIAEANKMQGSHAPTKLEGSLVVKDERSPDEIAEAIEGKLAGLSAGAGEETIPTESFH